MVHGDIQSIQNQFHKQYMEAGHKIVAIQKTFDKSQQKASWNNSTIRWFFFHKTSLSSKSYEVSLEIVYLSSKRNVKVNGELKHTSMVTFGYECQFEIAMGLAGKIKQDGISFNFQLFINDVAFTQLESNKPKYEALSELDLVPQAYKINIEKVHKEEAKQKTQNQVTPQPKQQKPVRAPVEMPFKEQPINEEQRIKDTQKQLLKILKAQKQQKK